MDRVGKKTLEIMSQAVWYNTWLFGQIKKYVKGDILEVGAGIGNFTPFLKTCGKVIAIDYDPVYKNTNFGDIEKGKYFFKHPPAGGFDTIVCMNVLEHIKDDKRALTNMSNLLKNKGKLILLVPAHQWAYGLMDKNLGHIRRYNKNQLSNILKANSYSLIAIRYLNWLGLIGWFVNGRIFRKKIIPTGQLGIFDKLARPFLLLEETFEPSFGLSVLVIGEKK